MGMSRIDAKRAAAKRLTPWRDQFRDWLKIKFMWLGLIVLVVLLIKYGGGDINH